MQFKGGGRRSRGSRKISVDKMAVGEEKNQKQKEMGAGCGFGVRPKSGDIVLAAG